MAGRNPQTTAQVEDFASRGIRLAYAYQCADRVFNVKKIPDGGGVPNFDDPVVQSLLDERRSQVIIALIRPESVGVSDNGIGGLVYEVGDFD